MCLQEELIYTAVVKLKKKHNTIDSTNQTK